MCKRLTFVTIAGRMHAKNVSEEMDLQNPQAVFHLTEEHMDFSLLESHAVSKIIWSIIAHLENTDIHS